jgi:glycosyltransferase involved in cell wall biosynthesis
VKLLWVTAKRLASDLASTTQLAVSAALTKRGWDVTIVAPEGDGAEAIAKAGGITFVGVKRSKKAGFGWLTFGSSLKRTMPSLLNDGGFDVALVEWQAVAGTISSMKNAGTPWLIVDRSPPVFRSLAGRLQWLEYRRAWRLASRKNGANGSVLKSQALADWHRAKQRIIEPTTLMEAGVDVSNFSVANFSGPMTIIHHGQLDEEREIERIVHIGEVLSARGMEFKIKIAGSGNRLTALQKIAYLQDWLEVVGPLPSEKIPEFLATGHLAIFPLPDSKIWRLASPLKVREWAAVGLPMILSDITPHRSVGERTWIRLVTPHAPFDEWADCVEDLLKENLVSLGKQARVDAESEFDWNYTTEELHTRLLELKGG